MSLIPREILFGNPLRVSPALSPDGKNLAYLAPRDGVMNLWLERPGEEARVITNERERGLQHFMWAKDGRHLLYIQDKGGDENWHLYAVDLHEGKTRDLTPFEGVQAQFNASSARHPSYVLVGLNRRDPKYHDIYRLELETGELKLMLENTIGAAGFTADQDLRVRLALLPQDDGSSRLLHRLDAADDWQGLLRWNLEDDLNTAVWGFAADGETLYLQSSVGRDTAAAVSLNVVSGEQTVLASDNEADVSGFLMHPTTKELQAVSFLKARREWQALEPELEADFAALRELCGGDFSVISRNLNDRTWLVAYTRDQGSVAYYRYARGDKAGEFLFSARPELDEQPLVAMKPISYRARDGLIIHGYLSLPEGASENLPTVLNIHGGPWARNAWGYNAEAQWLANRGYACLQLNFRGSTGYGKAFVNAGDREWGGKMQDDITDAAKWLVEQGISDPNRIGIMGGSYGGYAVLSGLTKTPELYACGVDIVGPSNLITLQKTIPPYWESFKPTLYKRVGHPEEDAEFLKERSPLSHIDNIQAPLLIAQGANDPRVKRSESLQMVEALERAGKTVEYLEFPDEGHGLVKPENRLNFFARAEAFLAEHLGGETEP